MTEKEVAPRSVIIVGATLVPELLRKLDEAGLTCMLCVDPVFRISARDIEHVDPGQIIEPRALSYDTRPTFLEMVSDDARHRYAFRNVRDCRKEIRKGNRRHRR